MTYYRPRSIVGLILVGFAVVVTPFIAAVVTSIFQLDRLARDSQSAVLNASRATEESRVLVEQVTEMQRALGQFSVSGDRDFHSIYLDRRRVYTDALENLRGMRLAGLDAGTLDAIARAEAEIFALVEQAAATADAGTRTDEALEKLRELGRDSRAILELSDALIRQQANNTTESAAAVQRLLLALTAAAVPVTVVLIAVFTVLISRPMRALGRAIRRLGSHDQVEAIEVHGPEDIEELGRQLDWLRLRIQALEKQRANFLRQISHELKTPLTTIREGSELLTETLDEDMPEEAEIARLMKENGIQLQQLIEDLLDFARTQEIEQDLELEEDVDLADLLERAVSGQAVVADARDITFELKLAPVSVTADARKLATVFENLVTNAIKFSPDHGRIVASLARQGSFAVVDICDSGPGVAPEEREAIFEPFYQGDADYRSSVKGTGLGLSIAREYVEVHQGTIEVVESRSGGHFRVTVPIEASCPRDKS